MLRNLVWILLILSIALNACGNAKGAEDSQENNKTHKEPGVEAANIQSEVGETVLITMENVKGEKVGEASLEEKSKGVEITLNASDLPPGTHGFHIHEVGLCQVPTFGSAEGHFNPTQANHGFNDPKGPHAGDLPNIEVEEDGSITTTVFAEMVTLEKGKENSLLKEGGTSLMIHEKADDYKSQPSGDAGERIACGVITE